MKAVTRLAYLKRDSLFVLYMHFIIMRVHGRLSRKVCPKRSDGLMILLGPEPGNKVAIMKMDTV